MQLSVFIAVLCSGVVLAAPPKAPETTSSAPVPEDNAPEGDAPPPESYPAPQIDWGKCPQLKPSDEDKEQKRVVIQKCLEQNPPPALETITDPKQIDTHREVVTTCALKKEGWFNDDGSYKFDKAKAEIQSKSLEKEVEKNISKRHEECEEEAAKRYPQGYIEQVQLYQACMDYHIAEICEIELIAPPDFPVEMYLDDDVPPEEILRQLLPGEESSAEQGEPEKGADKKPEAAASTLSKSEEKKQA